MFATAGADGTVKLVESLTGRVIRTMTGSGAFICLDISEGIIDGPSSSSSSSVKSKSADDPDTSDGLVSRINTYQYLLAGGSDGTSRLWDLSTGVQLRQLQGHANKVHSCHLFGGRAQAVTGSADRTIKFWDIQHSGHAVRTVRTTSSVLSVCPTMDHSALVSGHQDGSVRVWDTATGASAHVIEKLHTSHVTCVTCSTNGYHLLTASKDNTLSVIDMRRYEKLFTLKAPSSFRIVCDWSRACFSPCGRYVAAGGGDGTVVLWSVATGRVAAVLPSPLSTAQPGSQVAGAGAITGVCWSRQPSGHSGGIFAGTKSGAVCVWR
jgi:autophagy-related protein 16